MNYPIWERRKFLEFMGKSAILSASLPYLSLIGCGNGTEPGKIFQLKGLNPSLSDQLELPNGFDFRVMIKQGDPINSTGLFFGDCNDYLAVIPDTDSSRKAILWVNHEYFNPVFITGNRDFKSRTRTEIHHEMKQVGGSILSIEKNGKSDLWEVVLNDKINKRLDAHTEIPFDSDPIQGSSTAIGTLANCAGGVTPWGTILTCEENFGAYFGTVELDENKVRMLKPVPGYNWNKFEQRPPEHYGWVVEVNVHTGKAKKLTGLGRFEHECAKTVETVDKRCVVYTGDDKEDECVYKFIAAKPGTLTGGELYVANVDEGKWILLDIDKTDELKGKFKNQLEMLIHCREAAHLVGGSKLDRPEDIDFDPKTGTVYVTLTNNKAKDNYHGSVIKIIEKDGDPLSMKFEYELFKAGGLDTGFSSPDNLLIDHNRNIWLTSDISGSQVGKGPYEGLGNNGLFFIPMSGSRSGIPIRVANAPVQAEFTGPCISPDNKSLFLAVQHPGEKSQFLDQLTSHWPEGGNSVPRSSVVEISGPGMEALLQGRFK